MYLSEEALILLIVEALIRKKQGKTEGKSCGCSIEKEMKKIEMEDKAKTVLPLSPMMSKRGPDVSGVVKPLDAPVFTSGSVLSSLPASSRSMVSSRGLPPSPRSMVSLSGLPPSPRSVASRSTKLPPSPSIGLTSKLPPSPSIGLTSKLPPSPRSVSTLPPSPRNSKVSALSSLSYKSGGLPKIQKSPVATRTSLPTLSSLTQLK